jgi:hypothetical protein
MHHVVDPRLGMPTGRTGRPRGSRAPRRGRPAMAAPPRRKGQGIHLPSPGVPAGGMTQPPPQHPPEWQTRVPSLPSTSPDGPNGAPAAKRRLLAWRPGRLLSSVARPAARAGIAVPFIWQAGLDSARLDSATLTWHHLAVLRLPRHSVCRPGRALSTRWGAAGSAGACRAWLAGTSSTPRLGSKSSSSSATTSPPRIRRTPSQPVSDGGWPRSVGRQGGVRAVD